MIKPLAAALAAGITALTASCAQSPDAQFLARCKAASEIAEGRTIKVMRHSYTNAGAPKEMWHVQPGPGHSGMVIDYRAGELLKRRLCSPMKYEKMMASEWPISMPVPVQHISLEAQAKANALSDELGVERPY